MLLPTQSWPARVERGVVSVVGPIAMGVFAPGVLRVVTEGYSVGAELRVSVGKTLFSVSLPTSQVCTM